MMPSNDLPLHRVILLYKLAAFFAFIRSIGVGLIFFSQLHR
jgi:hypothetical protein